MLRGCVIAALLLVAFGCGDDDGPAPDAGPPADASQTDPDGSDDSDAGSPVECDFPAVSLGDSDPAQALASSPARCGQDPHAWVDDPSLGDVLERERVQRLTAALLRGALNGAGYELPRPIEHDVAIDRILYRTQDRGELVEATAAVAYPADGLETPGPHDVVLLLHGTTGFADACAPSNTLEGQALAALFASLGYVTIAPDYIGLKALGTPSEEVHPYLVGQATAIASLDSVRALGKLAPSERADLCVAPRVLVFGGSQGGHAALWVDRLSDTYAPEIELLGVAATVPPIDLLGQVERGLQSAVDATANSIAMLGAASQWYGVDDRLGEVFRAPYDVQVIETLAASCSEDAPDLPDLTLEDLFQPAVLDAASAGTFGELDPWGCLVGENGLTTTSIERTRADDPGYGILLTFGGADELVHTPIEREAYRSLCEAGVPVTMLECEGAGHAEGTIWAMPEILDFMDARSAGIPFVPGPCEPPAPVVCAGTPAG